MPFIRPLPDDEVTGAVAEPYEADLAEDGYVSNVPELLPAARCPRGLVQPDSAHSELDEDLRRGFAFGHLIEERR